MKERLANRSTPFFGNANRAGTMVDRIWFVEFAFIRCIYLSSVVISRSTCPSEFPKSEWRRERDSNPRYCLGTHAFQACALNHSAISPTVPLLWPMFELGAIPFRVSLGTH